MQSRKTFLETLAIIGGIIMQRVPDFYKYPAMPGKANHGISHLKLVCNQLDEQENFYTKILELTVQRINDKSIKVQAGTTEIIFYENSSYIDPVYHFAFNIPENKLEDAIAWLKKKNVTLAKTSNGSEIFDFKNWNAHSIYWQDAAGNVLEFIARHNLPTTSSTKFSRESILYASEIGLVVDDVALEIKNIRNNLDLETFKVHTDNFAAIGNEYNLLIVVQKNRPWLGGSANIPAQPFPVVSYLQSGNKKADMNFTGYPFSLTTDKAQ